jgi:hypothetical protein
MMTSLPLTFGRALKVWWSYMWRGMLLTIPLMVLVQLPAMFFLFRQFQSAFQPGQPIDPRAAFSGFRYFFALWIVMAVSMVLVHTQALRWALRTRWADFRLIAVDPSESVGGAPPISS